MPLTASVTHNRPPAMPEPRIGALSNWDRWSLIVESIAQLLADGERSALGQALTQLARLPIEEQTRYRRAALVATMPIAAPAYVDDAHCAAIHKACEVWQGHGDDRVTRVLAGRMFVAWQAWAFRYLEAAIDGTIPQRIVSQRAETLRQLIAPSETKGGVQ